ncbi:hypothetical protein JR316_0002580 [Psilocybe cubensis]|uniref:Uncharacterized protein n=1 Tax=Psilocybe cubensis TaxID=181762 RepID=A0ACB8HD66_PSICU|nr:hypothetical protein JR316_0002580 [Psilocybe cubensis]KAH9485670.1 hypothetical protein JR316_0002580 [Psilocybe cubensis]
MPRLPLVDILHRGVVYSLAGLTVYGVVMSVLIHRDTIRRGEVSVNRFNQTLQIMLERKALGLPLTKPKKEEISEEVEQTLAEQAQAIFKNRRPS